MYKQFLIWSCYRDDDNENYDHIEHSDYNDRFEEERDKWVIFHIVAHVVDLFFNRLHE